MKIVFDARYIGKGGIGTFAESILACMLKYDHTDSFLVIKYPNQKILPHENVTFLETTITPFSLKEILHFPVQRINTYDAYFSPYINIPNGIKIPIYSTVHDVIFFDLKGLTNSIGRMIRKFFYKACISKSKAIFTVSNFSKDRIEYHFHTKKRIKVIYNGISPYIKSFKVSGDKKNYIVYVGNVKQHKGIDLLIEAFNRAVSKGYQYDLLIIGEYNDFRTSANLTRFSNCNNGKIKFSGRVDDKTLCKLVSEAHRLILPSRYEGFGIPPLEALYLGTEVLISDIPVFKEIYGLLPVSYFRSNDINDLTVELLEDKKNITDISNLRNEIDSKYNYHVIADKIINFIHDTC